MEKERGRGEMRNERWKRKKGRGEMRNENGK